MPSGAPGLLRTTASVGEIPVLVVSPRPRSPRGLAIWLPPLGGTKEQSEPALRRLAGAGLVAVSIDPRRHGERADRPVDALFGEAMAHFRAVMWPILGGTALDAMAVLDWAVEHYRTPGPVLVGGVSMGGDAALALAGIDHRVERVAAIAATPDWTRPGMTLIGRPDRLIDQGEPTGEGRRLRDRLEPAFHPQAYRRPLAIRFDVGTADTHVPAEAAHRFATLLGRTAPAARVEIIDHPGLDHTEVCRSPEILDGALDWLLPRSAGI